MFFLMHKDNLIATFALYDVFGALTTIIDVSLYAEAPFEATTESFKKWLLSRDFKYEEGHTLHDLVKRSLYVNHDAFAHLVKRNRFRCHEDLYWVKLYGEDITFEQLKKISMPDGD